MRVRSYRLQVELVQLWKLSVGRGGDIKMVLIFYHFWRAAQRTRFQADLGQSFIYGSFLLLFLRILNLL